MPPLEIQVFSPSSTARSPSMRAAHCSAATSRAGVGLRQREGGDRLAARHARQAARLLRRRAGQRDRARAQALHREGEVGQARRGVPASRGQAQHAGVDHVGGAAVGRAADRVAQPAGVAQLAHQAAAQRVDVRAVHVAHCAGGPGVERRGKGAVPLLEERPAQVLERVSVIADSSSRWHVGAVESSPTCTAPGPALGLARDSVHVPFLVQHGLGDAVGEGRPTGQLTCPGHASARAPRARRAGCRSPGARPCQRTAGVEPTRWRAWPTMRGSSAQAPMSQPARPTRLKGKPSARAVPTRRSLAIATIAPGRRTHAVDGGDDRLRAVAHGVTRSPVMRVNISNSGAFNGSAGR